VADEIRKESVAQAPEVASVATPTRTRPDCFRVQLNGPVNVWLVSVYDFTVCLLPTYAAIHRQNTRHFVIESPGFVCFLVDLRSKLLWQSGH
jgi:hypothetical protein